MNLVLLGLPGCCDCKLAVTVREYSSLDIKIQKACDENVINWTHSNIEIRFSLFLVRWSLYSLMINNLTLSRSVQIRTNAKCNHETPRSIAFDNAETLREVK